MATKTFTASENITGSSGSYWYLSNNFTFDKINAAVADMPACANVTKCELAYTVYRKTGSGATSNGNFEIAFSNTSSTVRSMSDGRLSSVLVLYETDSFKCNTEYKGTVDLTDYVNKSTGKISYSGATNIRFCNGFMYWAGGNDWKASSVTITWTYTEHANGGTEIRNATSATCTATGYTGDTYCKGCGTKISSGSTIAALGHSWNAATYTWSADGKTCTAKRICSRDSSHSETTNATISSAVKTAATCTAKGTTRYTANFGVTWATAQTKDVQDIPAKGHSYTSTVVPPTETSHGYTRHTCTHCGHYYDDSYTYLVRWYNEDGSALLETDSAVPYGDTPTYNGATPTKTDPTGKYDYTFAGWNISPTAEGTTGLTAVVANVNYYARFTSTINSYTVTWENEGKVIETDTQVPHGDPPDYNGPTPTKESTAQYDYSFLGWSVKNVDDGYYDESQLVPVTGHITYEAVYLPIVRKYDLDIVAYDCTVEGAVSGTYEYGTQFTIKVTPDFGYEFDKIIDDTNDVEYTDDEVTFYLNGNVTLLCMCKRAFVPIFASSTQQVKDIYVVPDINTIVYQVEGDLPTLTTTTHTVDDLHFAVINTDMDSSVYNAYLYYSADELYVDEIRIW